MSVLSDFETTGVWKAITGGLVHDWSRQPGFEATELDVPFTWNPSYNWGITAEEREEFRTKYKIRNIREIVEVFREPFNDVDASFKGRTLLVATFESDTDAIYFRLAMAR